MRIFTQPRLRGLRGPFLDSQANPRIHTPGNFIAANGAFDPKDLFGPGDSGGVYDISVLGSLWQDEAGTIPVTLAGQDVKRVDDLSGKGNHLVLFGPAYTPPTYQTDGTLHWLKGNEDQAGFMVMRGLETTPAKLQAATTLVTAQYVVSGSAIGQVTVTGMNLDPGAPNNFIRTSMNTSSNRLDYGFRSDVLAVGPETLNGNPGTLISDTPFVVTQRSAPQLVEAWINGVPNGTKALVWNTETTTGASPAYFGGQTVETRMYAFVAIDRTLDDAERVATENWCAERIDQFDPKDLFGVGDGGGAYDISRLNTLWQDEAGTIPVTADGQVVKRVDDISGNNAHLIETTAYPQEQVYHTDGTLHWLSSTVGDGSSGRYTMASPNGSIAMWPYMTLVSGIFLPDDLLTHNALNMGSTNPAVDYCRIDLGVNTGNGNTRTTARRLDQTGSLPAVQLANGPSQPTPSANAVYSAAFDNTSIRLFKDSMQIGANAATPWEQAKRSTDMDMRLYNSGTTERFYAGVAIDRTLTDEERQATEEWCAKRIGRFDPKDLFGPGDGGGYYDISQIGTLFQDTALTQPVTAAGQPVRGILDLSGNGMTLTAVAPTTRAMIYRTDGTLHWLEGPGDGYIYAVMQSPLGGMQIRAATTLVTGVLITDDVITGSDNRIVGVGGDNSITSYISPVLRADLSRVDGDWKLSSQGVARTYLAGPTNSCPVNTGHVLTSKSAPQTGEVRVDGGVTSSGALTWDLEEDAGRTILYSGNLGASRTYAFIAIDRTLTDEEREATENWCAKRTGQLDAFLATEGGDLITTEDGKDITLG